MPPLSEFLGHLMSEIVRARALADAESVRIATMYAADPLLRNFTVPRFRLPDLTIDVPMVINRIDGGSSPAPQPPMPRPTLRGLFETIVMEQLERLGAKARRSILGDLRRKLGGIIHGADDIAESVDPHAWGEQMLGRVLPQIKAGFDVDLGVVEKAIRDAWRVKLGGGDIAGPPKPPGTEPARIDVAFTPEELQAAGAANVTRFHLSVKENGIEWTTLERDGRTERRLVAE